MNAEKKTFEELAYIAISKLSSIVGTTLGPDGHTVFISGETGPIFTKDGVTVAKNFRFSEADGYSEEERKVLNNILVSIVEMSRKTDYSAGDGTTSTIVFAGELYKRLYELKKQGYNVRDLLDGVRFGVKNSKAPIAQNSLPVKTMEEIERVAFLSANNDLEVASILRNVFEKIGKSGIITFNHSNAPKNTDVRFSSGFRFPSGYASKTFVNNFSKKTVDFDEPYFLITDFEFTKSQELLQVINLFENIKKPLVIVCESIAREPLAFLVEANSKGVLRNVVITAPFRERARQEFYEDLCIFTSAKFISSKENYTFPVIKVEDLGKSTSVEVGLRMSVVVGGNVAPKAVQEHVEVLKNEIKATEDDIRIEELHARISRFAAGAAEIIIGGSTESEVRERRYRMEDALKACNNAFVYGYVPGGGLIYLYIQGAVKGKKKELPDVVSMQKGFDAYCDTLDCILDKLVQNAELSYERFNVKNIKETVKKKYKKNIGFDFKNKEYRNFLSEDPIIEPAGISQEVIENSLSIVSLLIGTKEYI